MHPATAAAATIAGLARWCARRGSGGLRTCIERRHDALAGIGARARRQRTSSSRTQPFEAGLPETLCRVRRLPLPAARSSSPARQLALTPGAILRPRSTAAALSRSDSRALVQEPMNARWIGISSIGAPESQCHSSRSAWRCHAARGRMAHHRPSARVAKYRSTGLGRCPGLTRWLQIIAIDIEFGIEGGPIIASQRTPLYKRLIPGCRHARVIGRPGQPFNIASSGADSTRACTHFGAHVAKREATLHRQCNHRRAREFNRRIPSRRRRSSFEIAGDHVLGRHASRKFAIQLEPHRCWSCQCHRLRRKDMLQLVLPQPKASAPAHRPLRRGLSAQACVAPGSTMPSSGAMTWKCPAPDRQDQTAAHCAAAQAFPASRG